MLHELAHCDHMNHDDQFWKLFRQLEREVVELDWRKTKGYVLGHGNSDIAPLHLPGTLIHHPPKDDIVQLSPQSNENDYVPEIIPDPLPKPLSPHQEPVVTLLPKKEINPLSFETIPIPMEEDLPQNPPSENISQEQKLDSKKETEQYWSCSACTYHNHTKDNICQICGSSKTIQQQSITEITNESSLLTIQQSTSDIERTLSSEIDQLLKTTSKEEANHTLKTIRTILGNLLHHPNEEKFKKISLTNKVYQNKIAKYPTAHQILLKAGFEEDKQQGQLIFNRKDYGLIWLACSLIDSKEP